MNTLKSLYERGLNANYLTVGEDVNYAFEEEGSTLYILFEKSYSHINGSLECPNPDIPVKNICTSSEITFDNAEINDCGKFVRAFQTLEDAKGYAVAIANTRQYANINNLYIPTKPK